MKFGLLVALAAEGFAALGAPEKVQTFALVKGWNAVRVEVGPKEDADTLFRDWPVEWVALYDPAAYLNTRQYSGRATGEGVVRPGYRTIYVLKDGVKRFWKLKVE